MQLTVSCVVLDTMQYIWDNGVMCIVYAVGITYRHCYQVDQGLNKYIRVPPNNNPVTDVTSTDLTCNVNGRTGTGVSTLSIAAGTTVRITLE